MIQKWNELYRHLPFWVRLLLALALFGAALAIRLWLLPISAGYQFLTFYPAMVAAFYLTGVVPGALMAILSAVAVFYTFVPPYLTFDKSLGSHLGAIFFFISAGLIFIIVRQLQQVTAEQQAMLDNDLVGIARVRNRHLVWKNRGMDRIFGYEPGELNNVSVRKLFMDDASFQSVGEEAYPILQAHGSFRSQICLVRKDGQPIWLDASAVQLSQQEYLWMYVDITQMRLQQTRIEQIAYHDLLTDLPNRLLLHDRLEQALAQVERSNRYVAVCYLDLDGFKPVNDTFGHDAGDFLLREVALRMQAATRANDTVARFGGDEFVLLLADLVDPDEHMLVLRRVMEAVGRPIAINQVQDVMVSASIGVTLYPMDASDADGLLRHADLAMYQSKKSGGNCISLYSNRPQRCGAWG